MTRTRLSLLASGVALTLGATVLTMTPSQAAPVQSGAAIASAADDAGASAALRRKKKKTKIKASVTARDVVVLQPSQIVGKVNGPRRKVTLQLKNAYGWRKVAKQRTNRKGKFTFTVPTNWYGKKKMRLVTPETRKFRGDKKKLAANVLTGYAPLGDRRAWSDLASIKTRYNPCQAVKWQINPGQLPADGVAVVNEALFRISIATGLRYQYKGTTDAIPFRSAAGPQTSRRANLAIAFASPNEVADLAGGVLGIGGFLKARPNVKRRTGVLIKTGLVVDNTDAYNYRGFENGEALGMTVLHELTHALGMGHAEDPNQIMYFSQVPERQGVLYGAGDLSGLKKHGIDAGCIKPQGRGARIAPVYME